MRRLSFRWRFKFITADISGGLDTTISDVYLVHMAEKQKKKASYKDALMELDKLIHTTGLLLSDAQKNGDQIAMWTLTFVYEDLIKSYHRLGNVRLTVKGDKT